MDPKLNWKGKSTAGVALAFFPAPKFEFETLDAADAWLKISECVGLETASSASLMRLKK